MWCSGWDGLKTLTLLSCLASSVRSRARASGAEHSVKSGVLARLDARGSGGGGPFSPLFLRACVFSILHFRDGASRPSCGLALADPVYRKERGMTIIPAIFLRDVELTAAQNFTH